MADFRNDQRGSVLLVTLCFVAVLAIALTSYISLSSVAMNVSNRSYQTGVSEQLAEMGLERALQAFNTNNWTGWDTVTTPNTATLTITFPTTKYGNSGIAATINLQVSNYNAPTNAAAWNSGTAYSANTVVSYLGAWYSCIAANTNQVPPNATYWSSTPLIYSEGKAVLPNSAATTIRTQLRAVITSAPLFPNAVGATTSISLASASGTIDSFNSKTGTYASQTGTATNYSADVASPSVTISGATTVQGYVSSPSFSYNVSSTVVKSLSSPGSPKVDSSRVSSSPYIPQFDPQAVTSSNFNFLNAPGSFGTINLPRGTDTVSADGKYYYYTSGSLTLYSGDTININGNVVIDIRPTSSADLYLGGGTMQIAASGASLEIHFGDELYLGTNSGGGIQNLSLDPKKCIIIGTSTYNYSSYHYFWTTMPFYGVVYMPYAYLHVWNAGSPTQIYGALSASNVYFNHAANVHYDSSLRNTKISGADAPYIISEWRELTNSAEKVTFP